MVAGAAAITTIATSAPVSATGTIYVVSPTGDDRHAGSATAPFRTLQRAVTAARAGSTIQLRAGTYTGPFAIEGKSGTKTAPITVEPAGNGPVVLTAALMPVPCGRSQPALRTLNIGPGADYWTIKGLNIRGGVSVKGTGWHDAFLWLDRLVDAGDWQHRRTVPGHGLQPDAQKAFAQLPAFLAQKTHADIDPSDGISILNNTITGRGIWTVLARQGVASGNTITDIDCGTGPAAWFNTFSDGWTVSRNTIARVAPSTYMHYMQEGIRLGSATSFVQVHDNKVSDIHGTGRAYATDVDASYNTFSHNSATNVYIGYNEQMSGWGNVWEYNSVSGYSVFGYSVRVMDGVLAAPSWSSSSYKTTFRCNTATGGPMPLSVGAARQGTFTRNGFTPVTLSDNLRSYWNKEGNLWDGLRTPPAVKPAVTMSGCERPGPR